MENQCKTEYIKHISMCACMCVYLFKVNELLVASIITTKLKVNQATAQVRTLQHPRRLQLAL